MTAVTLREFALFRKWFSKRLLKNDAPLTGAPQVRRLKSHSAESGYVYEYRHEGQRPYGGEAGIEYVFQFCGDRKHWRRAGVVVTEECLGARVTNSTERYAIAKMALLQAFDEAAPEEVKDIVVVTAAQAAAILERLGLA